MTKTTTTALAALGLLGVLILPGCANAGTPGVLPGPLPVAAQSTEEACKIAQERITPLQEKLVAVSAPDMVATANAVIEVGKDVSFIASGIGNPEVREVLAGMGANLTDQGGVLLDAIGPDGHADFGQLSEVMSEKTAEAQELSTRLAELCPNAGQ